MIGSPFSPGGERAATDHQALGRGVDIVVRSSVQSQQPSVSSLAGWGCAFHLRSPKELPPAPLPLASL